MALLIRTIIGATVYAGLSVALGHVAHEATHVLLCALTGSRVESIGIDTVTYKPSSAFADAIVRSSTVLLSVPLLFAYGWWLLDGIAVRKIYVGAFVFAYLPRSGADWNGVVQFIALSGRKILG